MRLVVLTSCRFGIASECLPALVENGLCTVARVIVSSGKATSHVRRLRQKARKIMRIGPLGALNGLRMRSWYDGSPTLEVSDVCRLLGIPVFETDRTNSEETTNLMREADADLGVSLGNSYIAERVFGAPRFGMINVHGERLPEYQNAQSVIWPIHNMETTTGLTIHQVDRSIDTGKILYREEFPIAFHARLEDTVRATTRVTRQRTPAAVRYVCENYERLAAEAISQKQGRVFTTPTIWQFLRMVRNNTLLYTRLGQVGPATTDMQ